LFAYFIPVFTPVIASLFLHETWHLYHGVGLVMIILGVLMVHFSRIPLHRPGKKIPARPVTWPDRSGTDSDS